MDGGDIGLPCRMAEPPKLTVLKRPHPDAVSCSGPARVVFRMAHDGKRAVLAVIAPDTSHEIEREFTKAAEAIVPGALEVVERKIVQTAAAKSPAARRVPFASFGGSGIVFTGGNESCRSARTPHSVLPKLGESGMQHEIWWSKDKILQSSNGAPTCAGRFRRPRHSRLFRPSSAKSGSRMAKKVRALPLQLAVSTHSARKPGWTGAIGLKFPYICPDALNNIKRSAGMDEAIP